VKKFKFNFLPNTKFVWINEIVCYKDQINIWKMEEKFVIKIENGRKFAGITGPRFYEVGFSIPVSKLVFTQNELNFSEMDDAPEWFYLSKTDAYEKGRNKKINEENKQPPKIMSPENFTMENSFIHNGMPNDIYIFKNNHYPFPYKFPVIGYCDSMDVTFRPKPDCYCVMFWIDDDEYSGAYWTHAHMNNFDDYFNLNKD